MQWIMRDLLFAANVDGHIVPNSYGKRVCGFEFAVRLVV